MRFPEENYIECLGADGECMESIPSNINFKFASVKTDRVHLVAPGYGGFPHGKGPIVVFVQGGIRTMLQLKAEALAELNSSW